MSSAVSRSFALLAAALLLAVLGSGCDECETSCDCIGQDLGVHPACVGEPICNDGSCAHSCRAVQPEACEGDEVWDEALGICSELTMCER